MVEITAASDEQSEGIRQINHAIEQIDDMTQQNSALVEQAAAAAQSMHDQAIALGKAVSIFKIDNQEATLDGELRTVEMVNYAGQHLMSSASSKGKMREHWHISD
jgi:methyl-accepting chemotaxis protein